MTPTTVFLTGATGFLGAQIAHQILSNDEVQLITLVRAPNPTAAQERLRREWWDWPELRTAATGRVRALAGDVTLPRLGLDEETYAQLAGQVTHIIHSAADVRLFEPLAALRRVNVEGTRHALELGRSAHAAHGLARFAHISTAYVAGERSGAVSEDELSDHAGFSSPYEQSKYEAELLVRQAAGELPVSIFRPGMIVGDSHRGAVRSFNTLYYPLRLYLSGRLSWVPASPHLRVNLVPVDYVAGAVARLTFDPRAAGLTFHLTPPLEDQPELHEVTALVRRWAAQNMHLKLPAARFFPVPGIERLAGLLSGPDLAPLARLMPYFHKQPLFLRANSDRLLGAYPHRWQELLPPLLAYAVHYSFWHRTTRTVHEQILFRLQSQSKPVYYHDLSGGKEYLRKPDEMRAEMLAAVAALRAQGVVPGDRVAIVGLNSSRYFSALVACGLCGAVSVPLYATCPPDEIERLLADCRPRLFLVGVPGILARLHEIHFRGPVVSLCRKNVAAGGNRPVLSWDEFLAQGRGQDGTPAWLGLDTPAVLYYTSGTTGRPKAVLFQHAQLRWLAETLASMYPWRERNRWGSYLSYLPMNHVVEGALASYSPYYVPAALDIYFLEEFGALQQALTRVRPTIFFSVPRFFEKVRVAALENPLARLYLKLAPGSLGRRLLGRLVRRGLLRKSGLNGARMMIVGSALSAPGLLGFFHDLGIEVHDAYGLTEAPLITLNRLGRNRVGTLGEPLPETEMHIGPAGEIRVHGPQVASGYVEDGVVTPFAGGWLETGDLGCLSPDGYLQLNGRKKDLIITSYAKNIFPAPIEASLRALPGVAEAMLVGEGRPYCTALIWLEANTWSPACAAAVEAGVTAINARLSHPEQIKRWAVLPGSLTVENGELTGSMKVKRSLVAERMAAVIEALYRGEPPPGALHCGGLRRQGP